MIADASRHGGRVMAFVAGVPGSGKTLVGLRLVYERSETEGRATFLSGNGPLVQVLQDALESRVFVRDIHAFIRTYGFYQREPAEHVLVFDEAQRAWDEKYMYTQRGVAKSEPQLLVEIAERIPTWSSVVGLVGSGQEIYSGEEAGMPQWSSAIREHASERWQVHCPPSLAESFQGLEVFTHGELDLTVSLRSRRAEQLHEWVALLLQGSLPLAARLAARIQTETYPMYLTRDIEEARRYARRRYVGQPDARYGLVASSHAKGLVEHGVDNDYLATRKLRVAKWFNAPKNDPLSCCRLIQPVTEFQCQGLELDLPIVCWGADYAWNGLSWTLRPKRRRYPLQDANRLLQNAYRVLLTRGRDGFVVFLPPSVDLDLTEHALLAAGVRPLPEEASDELIAEEEAV